MKQIFPNKWADTLKRYWITVAIVLGFALISLTYFSPAIFEGRDLFQMDVAGASGTAQDVRDYYEATGETSYWTNSLFSGMPMYQIAPSYPSLSPMKYIQDFMTLQWPMRLLPSYSWLIFAMLVGFYIFMRSLSVGRLGAVLGAVMWTFSSYFLILIEAGHIWKLMVLAFIPPTIAGIMWTYRGRYLLGGVVTAFFAALQLMSNHIQMSYYFAFVIGFIIIGHLVEAIKQKRLLHFGRATATVLLAAVISIAMNSSNLYHTYQYSQETMRGGSALSQSKDPSLASGTKSGGLDKDYITAWSYGIGETSTLLIPNTYGGATGYMAERSELLTDVPANLKEMMGQMNQYWGDQPFTSGPVYVGAFVLMLAILGLFIIRTPLKWALLAATILSITLSWGHNMMWLTDLFIDYFPLYNKFRTVSSILVIAEFTIPTLAILALVEFVRDPMGIWLRERRAIYIAVGSTLGVCLLIALVPGIFFGFLSGQEQEMFRQYIGDPRAQALMSALKDVRADIVSADAWRSALIIMLSLGVCVAYMRQILRRPVMLVLLIAITLADLWLVNKRYLSDSDFIDTTQIMARANPVTPIDQEIKQDRDLQYRVLNASVGNPFSDATTSYSHRSVGGYHAAKLARYQDIIEEQLSKGNQQVLNMLNTRYIIGVSPQGQLIKQTNPNAFGAAWFVDLDQVLVVDGAHAEMAALSALELKYQAVMDRSEGVQGGTPRQLDSVAPLGSVRITEHKPDRLAYEVETDRERLLVFSEIYYPHGWQLRINDQPAQIKRANYVLRATVIPAGKHKLTMTFDPPSIHLTETIAWIAQSVLLLACVALVMLGNRRRLQPVKN